MRTLSQDLPAGTPVVAVNRFTATRTQDVVKTAAAPGATSVELGGGSYDLAEYDLYALVVTR